MYECIEHLNCFIVLILGTNTLNNTLFIVVDKVTGGGWLCGSAAGKQTL